MALQIKLDFHANQEPSSWPGWLAKAHFPSFDPVRDTASPSSALSTIYWSTSPRRRASRQPLSRAATTSEATVSRFCRKLGFGSFRSFQFSLARMESQRNEGLTDEVSLDNMEQSLKNILAAKVSELNATIDGIDHDTLAAVVHALKHPGVIEFAAVGNTNAVALDATFKFSQLGLRCMASTISETSIGFALTLRPGDVIVLISNSGKSRRLNRMAKVARDCSQVTW